MVKRIVFLKSEGKPQAEKVTEECGAAGTLTAGGIQHGVAALEDRSVVSYRTGHLPTVGSTVALPQVRAKACTSTLLPALFVIAKIWNLSRRLLEKASG